MKLTEIFADQVGGSTEQDFDDKLKWLVKVKRPDGKIVTKRFTAQSRDDVKDHFGKDFVSCEPDYDAMNEGKQYPKTLVGTRASFKKIDAQDEAYRRHVEKQHANFFATGKKGTHSSGEESAEYEEIVGGAPTGKRKWKLASGRWVNEAKNHLGEKEYSTWSGWRAACKKANPAVWFEGDKDIAQAFVGPQPYKHGETKAIGEWGGDTGSVYNTTVNEGWHNHKDGTFTADMSDVAQHHSAPRCPVCHEVLKQSAFTEHGDREGELTHWTLKHDCGAKLTIFNEEQQ